MDRSSEGRVRQYINNSQRLIHLIVTAPSYRTHSISQHPRFTVAIPVYDGQAPMKEENDKDGEEKNGGMIS
jgi:hypothetical protein